MNSSPANSPLDPDARLRMATRRHFFGRCGVGLGSIALGTLLNPREASASLGSPPEPVAYRPGHHTARARNVIFLFMAGGPSQLELFDHKPELAKWHDRPIPESFMKGKRFAFMNTFAKETPK